MTMPFGKHQGEDIADIPTGYLRWLRDNVDLFGELADAVEAELDSRLFSRPDASRRGRESAGLTIPVSTSDIPLLREIIESGYKAAARVHHPDAGGSVEAMQRLNALARRLRSQLTGWEAPS